MKKLLFAILGLMLLTACENYEIYQNIEYNYNIKRYSVETVFGQPKYYEHIAYGKGCQLDSIRTAEYISAFRWQTKLRDSLNNQRKPIVPNP